MPLVLIQKSFLVYLSFNFLNDKKVSNLSEWLISLILLTFKALIEIEEVLINNIKIPNQLLFGLDFKEPTEFISAKQFFNELPDF
jgi:hypothetical protein